MAKIRKKRRSIGNKRVSASWHISAGMAAGISIMAAAALALASAKMAAKSGSSNWHRSGSNQQHSHQHLRASAASAALSWRKENESSEKHGVIKRRNGENSVMAAWHRQHPSGVSSNKRRKRTENIIKNGGSRHRRNLSSWRQQWRNKASK